MLEQTGVIHDFCSRIIPTAQKIQAQTVDIMSRNEKKSALTSASP